MWKLKSRKAPKSIKINDFNHNHHIFLEKNKHRLSPYSIENTVVGWVYTNDKWVCLKHWGEVECLCVPNWMAIVLKLSERSQLLEGVCAPENRIARGWREGSTSWLFFPFLHFSGGMSRFFFFFFTECTAHDWVLRCLLGLQSISQSGVWCLLGRAVITLLWQRPK